jgi:aldose 1-epimerase
MKKLLGKVENNNIYSFELKNKNLKISILNYGAIIQKVEYKGKNLVLGFENLDDYIEDILYTGAFIGRNAGRISKAIFKLNDKFYQLEKNDRENNLHSGSECISKKIFNYNIISEKELELFLFEKENYFPGDLSINLRFSLLDDELIITITGKSNKDTIFNPTYHTYFNFNDDLSKSIDNHYLKISSDFFLELNDDSTPSGLIKKVNCVMDFNNFKIIKEDINNKYLEPQNGYDHPYVLRNENINAEIINKETNIHMKISTDLPTLIFYSGNFIPNKYYSIDSSTRCGFCLEPQYYPDFINIFNDDFILRADEEYNHYITYKFFNYDKK